MARLFILAAMDTTKPASVSVATGIRSAVAPHASLDRRGALPTTCLKGSVLSPLAGLIYVFVSAACGAGAAAALSVTPLWVTGVLGVTAAVLCAAYLVAFFYLLVTDPDALRSETYLLAKMATRGTASAKKRKPRR